MKSLVVITIIFLSTITILPSFAQSSSQEDNCPIGTKSVVKGTTLECVQVSNVKKTCPDGTYQGKDNQGNFACRDIKTNQIIDSNTGLIHDSQTGEIILDDEQMTHVGIGIFIVILIIAVIAKASQSKSNATTPSGSLPRHGWTELEKEEVRIRPNGKCNKCGRPPPRWEYHHQDGNRSNNSLRNCEGLCPNCHSVKTHDE